MQVAKVADLKALNQTGNVHPTLCSVRQSTYLILLYTDTYIVEKCVIVRRNSAAATQYIPDMVFRRPQLLHSFSSSSSSDMVRLDLTICKRGTSGLQLSSWFLKTRPYPRSSF
jgi:hypothetical protein